MAEPSAGAADQTAGDVVYQSLYRRFRPQRFADVRGQEHVTRALLNTVREGRISHAYLFSGPRGTGKTSTARILAMALNCAHLVDGEPDGTCASCVDIRRGVSTDVQELDAASNRRIDEIRDLLSRVALGTRGRWKVYIIDEVHQLTADAASALLKTLEEPPAHVVFVLATTDPQKVLPTIRSRTIPFDFHLLPSEVLGGLLRDVNEQAGLHVPPEAIDLVVRRGHGSARDALTVLDQVAAGGGGEDPGLVVSQIVEGLAVRDAGLVLTAVAEGMASGRDARRLAADLIEYLRNGFLATMARGLVMLSDDEVTEVAEQAHRLGLAALVRAMEVIGVALADMRDSVDPRVTLEVALVRLARPDADVSPAALLERIERLERGARSTGNAGPAGGSPRPERAEREAPGLPPSMPPRTSATVSPPPAPAPAAPAPGAPRAARSAPPAPPAPPVPVGSRPPQPAPAAPGGSRPPQPAPPMPGAVRPPQPTPPAPRDPALFPDGPAAPSRGAAAAPTPSTGPPAAAVGISPAPALPTRDELTKAWGDGVFRTLSAVSKGYLGSGRFVGVDPDGVVYAVAMLPGAREKEVRGDAEAALAARFGRPVPLKLVVEAADGPTTGHSAPAEPEVEDVDLDHLQDADVEVISPEQRLMDAFPGAEEVST